MISSSATRALLFCGVVLAPLFYFIVIVQAFTRAGFDIRIHPLSLLSLGPAGWIQITNFLSAGVLAISCAVGMGSLRRDGRGLEAVHWLISSFGFGMIIAGLSLPDPLLGFPPGSPPGIPDHMSVHASLHGLGFAIAFLSLIAACLASSRAFLRTGRTGWSLYSAVTAIGTVALLAIGFVVQKATSTAFFVVGIVAFGWVAVVARHLLGILPPMRRTHTQKARDHAN